METKSKYFQEIDICKGIAIILVIVFHAFILYPIRLIDIPWCKYIMDIIGSFFMPVFFLVSGFLFANSKNKSYTHILSSKGQRLFIPLLTFEVITLGLKLLVPSLINRKVFGIYDYIKNFILFGGELWFVYVLLLIFLIWGFLLPRMKPYMIIASIIGLQILHICIGGFASNLFLNERVIYFSTFFLLGYITHDFIREKLNQKYVFVALLLIFVLINVIFVDRLPKFFGWFSITAIVGSFFCWSLSFKLVNRKIGKWLSYCGKYSLQFYIFNGFALVPARVLMCNVLHITNTMALWISISIISIIGVIVITEIVKRIKYVNMLFGIK